MLRICVFVSGGGTNLQAILDRIEDGRLPGCGVVAVISSKDGVFALERAKKQGIPTHVVSRKSFSDMEAFDEALIGTVTPYKPDLIVLAGYLSLLGEGFIKVYANKIINVHPSLIPSFCGKGFYGIIPHQKALEAGVKVTGATVHFVEPEYDSGPIIFQKAVEVQEADTPESLQLRVMEEAEWHLLPEAIRLFSQGRLEVRGRHVRVVQNGI